MTKSCVRPVRREMAFCPKCAVNGKARPKRLLRQASGRSTCESESCSQQLEVPCKKCSSRSAWEWAETSAPAPNGGVGFIFKIWGAVHHLLKSDLIQGPVNAVSPRPVTNAEFTKALASVLSRPAIFPMPAFAARLVFGQMADELLLASQRIEPAKLISSGYPFQYPDLRRALDNLLKSK